MADYQDINDQFPILSDIDDARLEEFLNLRIKLAAHARITATLMYGSFIDDHTPNYNVSVFVDGTEYKFCMGWIEDATIIFNLALAPYKKEAHDEIVTYIMSYLNEL